MAIGIGGVTGSSGTRVANRFARLARRGRGVLAALMILAVAGAVMLSRATQAGGAASGGGALAGGAASGARAPARSPYAGMTQVVVRPGQTVWSLAAAAEPTANPWPVVQEIITVNALRGTQIQAGQVLWVPRN